MCICHTSFQEVLPVREYHGFLFSEIRLYRGFLFSVLIIYELLMSREYDHALTRTVHRYINFIYPKNQRYIDIFDQFSAKLEQLTAKRSILAENWPKMSVYRWFFGYMKFIYLCTVRVSAWSCSRGVWSSYYIYVRARVYIHSTNEGVREKY